MCEIFVCHQGLSDGFLGAYNTIRCFGILYNKFTHNWSKCSFSPTEADTLDANTFRVGLICFFAAQDSLSCKGYISFPAVWRCLKYPVCALNDRQLAVDIYTLSWHSCSGCNYVNYLSSLAINSRLTSVGIS